MNDVQEMVQVTMRKETYDFLTDLATKMKNQDHHGTRMPYVIQIAEDVEKPNNWNPDRYIWVDDEGTEVDHTYQAFLDYIDGYSEEYDEETLDAILEDAGIVVDDEGNLDYMFSDTDHITIALGLRYVGVEDVTEFSNHFLTQEAAKNHLENNRHHYHGKNQRTYVQHAYRNKELEQLIKAVEEITQINCFHT